MGNCNSHERLHNESEWKATKKKVEKDYNEMCDNKFALNVGGKLFALPKLLLHPSKEPFLMLW